MSGGGALAGRVSQASRTHAGAVGLDVVDTERLRRLILRWGDPLLDRLFTGGERAASRGAQGWRWHSLAGRFAAKEATKKVLASRGHLAGWTEIEVLNGQYGEPLLRLHGRAQDAATRCGFGSLLLSISHEGDTAVAVVLAN